MMDGDGTPTTVDDVERPTTVYDHPIGVLKGRTVIEEAGMEILYYAHSEMGDFYETYTMGFPKGMCPSGELTLLMIKRNGEYTGKQITFRRHWDMKKCADEVTAGKGEMAFHWRMKFEGTVEISTTFFGDYYTGDSGAVMYPRKAKKQELMRETVEEEMEFPLLFDVREGGTERVVGYSSKFPGNNFLKRKMEEAVAAGMKSEGIVFNQDKSEWASYPKSICDDCGRESCLWSSSEEEMILFNGSLPKDLESNGRRRMIYNQMAFKMNGNAPLGRGNRVQLPKCVLTGVRTLFPSADGEYMGHRDA
jgi:hypothetical protein